MALNFQGKNVTENLANITDFVSTLRPCPGNFPQCIRGKKKFFLKVRPLIDFIKKVSLVSVLHCGKFPGHGRKVDKKSVIFAKFSVTFFPEN